MKLYIFGLDSFSASSNKTLETCCFVSEDINIGSLKDGEFIQLDSKYESGPNSSVEFYIVDDEEHPIMPLGDRMILNEKIFHNQNTRFEIDDTKEYYIYRNGKSCGTTINNAITDASAQYTISYYPKNANKYKPTKDTIKIKIIFRIYDSEDKIPHVEYCKIRKYGSGTLWIADL